MDGCVEVQWQINLTFGDQILLQGALKIYLSFRERSEQVVVMHVI